MDQQIIAYSEVYVFISNLSESLKNKIPNKFYKVIKNNIDEEYCKRFSGGLDKSNYTKEAQIIIGMIYRDFLSGDRKQELYEKEKQELVNYQKQKEIQDREMISNIFSHNKSTENIDNNENNKNNNHDTATMNLAVKKESWYIKIFNKIKNIFRRTRINK